MFMCIKVCKLSVFVTRGLRRPSWGTSEFRSTSTRGALNHLLWNLRVLKIFAGFFSETWIKEVLESAQQERSYNLLNLIFLNRILMPFHFHWAFLNHLMVFYFARNLLSYLRSNFTFPFIFWWSLPMSNLFIPIFLAKLFSLLFQKPSI